MVPCADRKKPRVVRHCSTNALNSARTSSLAASCPLRFSVHDATSRLSRLLLVLSERGKDDTISFSQERLADMLGLRRSSVTLAARTLQSRRFISYRRGRIEIVNRKGLKTAACECYEVVSRTFDQFLEDKQVMR